MSNPETMPFGPTAASCSGAAHLNWAVEDLPCISRLPAFDDNYFWMIHHGRYAAVVDPGSASPVLKWLADHDKELIAILITHHHADHVGGVQALIEQRKLPAGESSSRVASSLQIFGPQPGRSRAIEGITHPVAEGDTLNLPELDLELSVIEVPGHTLDHLAYFGWMRQSERDAAGPREPVLFCGDTLFAGGCGRLFEGSAEQMWTSLSKLAGLPDLTRVYCAHEYTLSNLAFAKAVEPEDPVIAARLAACREARAAGRATVPTRIDIEKLSNPFLRAGSPSLYGELAGAQTFARLRTLKDGFRAP